MISFLFSIHTTQPREGTGT